MIKIAFIDVLGLTYDGSTLSKRGLGGSESAIILLSKELVKVGFDVTVYNDCTSDDSKPGIYDGVLYRPLSDIEVGEYYDVVIASRSVAAFSPPDIINQFKSFVPLPNFQPMVSKAKHKVLYMHDTFCDGDNLIEPYVNAGLIDEIFTLSDFHTNYVTNCDHGNRRNFEVLKNKIWQTRNGIQKHLDWVDVSKKDPNQFVFNASVTKGLIPLVERIWPRVKQQIPDAKLTVIGGYYRFREGSEPDEQEKTWRKLVEDHPEVNFTGIIKQQEIAEILAKSSYMIYPAAFPETFGISSLESLYYNTPLITNVFGALEETAIESACYKVPYAIQPNGLFPNINPQYQEDVFVQTVVNAYRNPYLHQQKMYATNIVKDICGWDTVALQWKQHLYRVLGLYLPVEDYRTVQPINERVSEVFGRRFTNKEDRTFYDVGQENLVVIVPFYNAREYIAKCIESIAAQDYDAYSVYLIDDDSTDDSYEVARKTLSSYPDYISSKFILHKNHGRLGALYNQVQYMFSYTNLGDIVVLVDGDDSLVNDPNVFKKINRLYSNGARFTYG